MKPVLSNVNLIVLAFFFFRTWQSPFHPFNFNLFKFLWCKCISSVQIKNKNKHNNLCLLFAKFILVFVKFLIYLVFCYLCLLLNCSSFSVYYYQLLVRIDVHIFNPQTHIFACYLFPLFSNSRLLIYRILIMHINTFFGI